MSEKDKDRLIEIKNPTDLQSPVRKRLEDREPPAVDADRETTRHAEAEMRAESQRAQRVSASKDYHRKVEAQVVEQREREQQRLEDLARASAQDMEGAESRRLTVLEEKIAKAGEQYARAKDLAQEKEGMFMTAVEDLQKRLDEAVASAEARRGEFLRQKASKSGSEYERAKELARKKQVAMEEANTELERRIEQDLSDALDRREMHMAAIRGRATADLEKAKSLRDQAAKAEDERLLKLKRDIVKADERSAKLREAMAQRKIDKAKALGLKK